MRFGKAAVQRHHFEKDDVGTSRVAELERRLGQAQPCHRRGRIQVGRFLEAGAGVAGVIGLQLAFAQGDPKLGAFGVGRFVDQPREDLGRLDVLMIVKIRHRQMLANGGIVGGQHAGLAQRSTA